MKPRRNALWVVFITVMTGLLFSACAGESVSPEDEEWTNIPAVLYFVNNEYAVTGDESIPSLIETTKDVMVIETENPWMVLAEALRIVPEEGMSTMITDEIRFRDIYISPADPGMIVVDLYSEGLFGGSLGEGLFIRQIVDTLIDNSDAIMGTLDKRIDKVQFLVCGEVVESLMGHYDATEPFVKGEQD